MKRFLHFAVVTACCGLSLTEFLAAAAPPLRIMPLGDSITDGVGAPGGYRGNLYNVLTAAGYTVDMVGNQTDNSEALVEKEHEGHSGWRIDQLDTNIVGWLNAIQDPDFVLIHIGTNDFGQGYATATAINRLDGLILKIAMQRPNANIIVTNLMLRNEPYNTQIQAQFNPYVQGVVNAHAAAGRKVTFLDMRSAVPLSDMPDQLHPGAAGYVKMANAYAGAIQAISTPQGDFSTPKVVRATGQLPGTAVAVTFSKPVADDAAAVGHYSIPGLTITGGTLDESKRIVTLTTSSQTAGTNYTVTINGVTDRQTAAVPVAAGSTATFARALPRGYQNYAAESSQYTLAYSLEIPVTPSYRFQPPVYQVDNRAGVGPFDRVAYYMELQGPDGQLQYVWASMDSFTNDVNKIAVPTLASGALFQQGVTNLSVISNVAGVTNGTGMQGNLEFWPNSYTEGNQAGLPGASATAYDYGDTRTSGDYGSMQLHNTGAGQTVFAFNNWGKSPTTGNADLGIGNAPAPVNGATDWTNKQNAGDYTIRTLQVLVRTSGDHTAPQVASAQASPSGAQVVVDFSEPVAAASVDAADFSLDQGVSVLAATLSADRQRVILTTSAQPVGASLSLTVTGIRDSSANANAIAANTVVNVTPAALPAEIVANVGSAANGYQLVYSADIGVTGNFNAGNAYRFDDHGATSTFSKVAYYLELQQNGQPTRYVWVSMDAFAAGRSHLAVPTLGSGGQFQNNVTNMQVISNVAGVTNGTTTTGGNIEFWPYNYDQGNARGVQNASGSIYDTGDVINTGGNYGSMQIHNHAVNQTVMAINNFGVDGNALDIGIGNNPAPVSGATDWTFAANAGNYSKRTLHVLVLPGQSTDPALVTKVPEAANYQLAYSLNIPATGNLQPSSGSGFTPYTTGDSGAGNFSRVAYYMELQKTGDTEPSYVWVSMDAFTKDGGQIGVPANLLIQKRVSGMNVVSNVAGIVNGTNIATGNIEFWSGSYNQSNAMAIPGASGTTYDFGDGGAGAGSGYGSMQVHNYGAGQTLFALNNWGTVNSTTNKLCVGIGNNPAPTNGGVDWTFADNAATWNVKRLLQVYVLPGNTDTTPPALVRATASATGDRVALTFDEPISEKAVTEAMVTIPGLTVTGLERRGTNELVVKTVPQAGGTTYTFSVAGLRDRSPAANAGTVNGSFVGYAAPAPFANVPEISGYKHVLSLAMPAIAPHYNPNGVVYGMDETAYGEFRFDRVAYLMELDNRWAYASFDAPMKKLRQVGVPAVGVSGSPLQGVVKHMNVASNVAGIVTGTDIATGNIEFWAGNYERANSVLIPGASDANFDFGDVMTAGAYGCMQIHNYGAGQTIMAFNNWGDNADNTDLGIGNSASPVNGGIDWTFAHNAASYAKRNLYVLVRPSQEGVTGPVLYSQPGDKTAAAGGNVSFTVSVAGGNAVTYQWRKNGQPIGGATMPWLDLNGVNAGNAGSYDVVVTGPDGVATVSSAGVLTVSGTSGPLPPSQIVRNADGSMRVVFYGEAGSSYLLQRCTTLLEADWVTLQTIVAGQDGSVVYEDGVPPVGKGFYRAVKVE